MALDTVRSEIRETPERYASEKGVVTAVEQRWIEALDDLLSAPLSRVVNATGVVIHTNLGRAPLAPEAVAAASEAASRYTPLEYDLEAGRRGSRYVHAARWLTALTGAEDAIVVNNNAAALLVGVDSLARGKAVVLSRGELVEIGGGFRVHEIVGRSGASIVEVGATNKTHVEDYERAIAEHDVGAILKVHRSNFGVSGFVAEVDLDALCELAGRHGVPVIFDQGSGVLEPWSNAPAEPSVREALASGAALVCASGDKLLGGPQAGLLFGSRDAIEQIRNNPLLRALRVDKATLAALEATLRLSASDPRAVPVPAMLERDPDTLRGRAETILAALGDTARQRCSVEPHAGRAGGGTLPDIDVPGFAIRIEPGETGAPAIERALRADDPPIIARVADEAVWLDVRTLLDGDDEIVAGRLDRILSNDDN